MTRITTTGRDQWGQASQDQRIRMIEQMPIERAKEGGAGTCIVIFIMAAIMVAAIIGNLPQ